MKREGGIGNGNKSQKNDDDVGGGIAQQRKDGGWAGAGRREAGAGTGDREQRLEGREEEEGTSKENGERDEGGVSTQKAVLQVAVRRRQMQGRRRTGGGIAAGLECLVKRRKGADDAWPR